MAQAICPPVHSEKCSRFDLKNFTVFLCYSIHTCTLLRQSSEEDSASDSLEPTKDAYEAQDTFHVSYLAICSVMSESKKKLKV